MTYEEINNYIYKYLKDDKTNTAILLSGPWGSGKSYYINHELVPFIKEKKKKAIVVSLYGLKDLAELSKSIYTELRLPVIGKIEKNEVASTAEIIGLTIFKNIANYGNIDISVSEKKLNKLYSYVNLKDKLLILEDMERSGIEYVTLLGYVNNLVERDGVKILLVANEQEIISSFSDNENQGLDKKKNESDRKVNPYYKIKEKTIRDTIAFTADYSKSFDSIIELFPSFILRKLIDKKPSIKNKVLNILEYNCKGNLRTLIYALQKTDNIFDYLNIYSYDDDFFECIFFGVLILSSNIKVDFFPAWKGKYYSNELGTREYPIFDFVYDYLKEQTIELSKINETYKIFNENKVFEKDFENKDQDYLILNSFYDESEERVLNALKSIEKRLNNPNDICFYSYPRLGYYAIHIGRLLSFEYQSCLSKMVKNAKCIDGRVDIHSYLITADHYSFDSDEERKEYKSFLEKLERECVKNNSLLEFSYAPKDIEEFYHSIFDKKDRVITSKKFLSMLDDDRIVDMLENSSAWQIDIFREVLFLIYRNASKNMFDEADVISMKKIKENLENRLSKTDKWDRIQKLQISYLISNLSEFIEQLS